MNKKETNKFRWCGQSMIPAKIYPKEELNTIIKIALDLRNNTPYSFRILANKLEFLKTNNKNVSFTFEKYKPESIKALPIYPKEILSEANQNIRNKVSPISDECWFQPWVVYYDIPLYACTFNWGTDLNNTMNKGINSWSHQKEENGYTRRDNWLNAVLNAYPEIYKKYKKLFNYDV